MAGEDELAEHVEAVLPNLVDVGATGALLWCFADYAEHLWDRPPCDPHGAVHERHFGLIRPDGTLKPHAEAVRRFAATRPVVSSPQRTVEVPVGVDQYYADPLGWARRLYDDFLEHSPGRADQR
jgi:endo-1,4-beta-mannosidase